MARPLLAFLIDVGPTDAEALRATLESLGPPGDVAWEALLVGAGAADGVDPADARVRVLSSASEDAGVRLDRALSEASGEYAVILPPGLRVGTDTLTELAAVLDARPDVDVFYTDQARPAGGSGWVVEARSAWSPERLRSLCYVGPCAGVRTSLAREMGGIREGLGGEHRYDLLLRAGERAAAVIGVPTAVRWAGPVRTRASADPDRPGSEDPDAAPPEAGSDLPDPRGWDARVRVVQQHLGRRIPGATALRGRLPGSTRVVRTLPPDATVTALVPARGDRGLAWGEQRYHVVAAVSSLIENAGTTGLEVVVGLSEAADPRVRAALADVGRTHDVPVRVEVVPGGFTPAQTVNHLTTRTDGDFLLVLQERLEVMDPDVVVELVGPLADADLGLTGPRVLTADGLHVGAGIGFYADRFQPMYEGRADGDPGRGGELMVTREVSALLPHAWATRRTHFREVGGLSEELVGVDHIDLAHKLEREGLRRLWVAPTRVVTFPAPVAVDAKTVWTAHELKRRALAVRWQSEDLDPYAPHIGRRRLDRLAQRDAELMSEPG